MPMDKPRDDWDDDEEFLDDEPEEDLPPARSMEEIRTSIERSKAQIAAGDTIEGDVFLAKLRAFIDDAKARRRADGPTDG